jgi:putative heme-binding domain-containing protein
VYRLLLLAVSLPIGAFFPLPARGSEPGIKVPQGFEVTKFAGDELARDIFSITTDAAGRIAVSGPGYVKILEDRDGDGTADRAHQFASIKTGAMGMYFDGPDLIYAGDNKVARLRDSDGDRIGDSEEVWTQLRNGEHGAHHIVKGPDGWFYLAAGNDAGVSRKHATTAGSPIKEPICGAILRFSPDGRQSEIVADGFRNMCGLDFNSAGHLFTVDSDNERDQHLPWYCPTRLFDVAIGQSHGWLQTGFQQGWNRPPYFFDSVERLVEIGRGSPTGVVVYRHRAWPKRYREGVFAACWSMGKIYFFPLTPHASSYTSKLEMFLEGEGATGLAIVGMAIDAAGDMYIAVGGRKTQGSVYRVRYVGPREPATAADRQQERNLRGKLGDKLYDVLTADQPLASWSRARWEPALLDLGDGAVERILLEEELPTHICVRAIEVLTEFGNGVPLNVLRDRLKKGSRAELARLMWSIGRKPAGAEAIELLVDYGIHDENTMAGRSAWEAIISLPKEQVALKKRLHFLQVDGLPRQRRPRAAMYQAYRRAGATDLLYMTEPRTERDQLWGEGPEFSTARLAMYHEHPDQQREAVRAMQLALGDVPNWEAKPEIFVGYKSEPRVSLTRDDLRSLVHNPPSDRIAGKEYARVLAMIGIDSDEAVDNIAWLLDRSETLEDDIHYLIVLARIDGTRSEKLTRRTAAAIVELQHKLAARGGIASRNWPLRVGELFEELCKKDAKLAEAVIDDERFGLPGHSLFVSKMTGDTQVRAARMLLAVVNKSEAEWDTDLISVLAVLPRDELRPHLQRRFQEPALQDAIAMMLAASPAKNDRVLLVEALASVQPNVVRAVAEGLARLDRKAAPAEIAEAMRALRRQTLAPNEKATRQALVALLKQWTGQSIDVEEGKHLDLAAVYRPWFDWFDQAHPGEAKKLAGFAGDLASWQKRLATIEWSRGHAAAGKSVYEKRSCHRCHGGSGRLGPDLAGAATRFSRDDLFAAIVDPNREVAPVYQTTEVVTDSGQVYNGLVVYESPETTMLQTGPDTVVRVGSVRKDGMRKSNVSLMPMGLLNDLSDRELADLYAYLKTLTN